MGWVRIEAIGRVRIAVRVRIRVRVRVRVTISFFVTFTNLRPETI